MSLWRKSLPVLLGIAGFIAAWSAWHLWIDHQNYHAVLHWIEAQAARPSAAK